jgi:hypothetical protein
MLSKSIIVVFLFATPTFLSAQTAPLSKEKAVIAAEELELVINQTAELNNKQAVVNLTSRAAMLVSFGDPARSEMLFRRIWKYASDQTDDTFDKEGARLVILKYLYSRNPKLARQLIAEIKKPESSSTGPMRRSDETSGKLGSQLVDTDPSAAADLLERSLTAAATPGGLGALSRLSEVDSMLSDYIATKLLDGLTAQPTIASLSTLFFMTAYVFPGREMPARSGEAESSLQMLQYRYFMVGLDVLRASLTETNESLIRDQHYAERDLQYRAANQGQIAAILAALAPRFQPSLAVELSAIASRLASQIPPNIAQMTKFALARLSGNGFSSNNPEENFAFSLSSGDFTEARKQLERLNDDNKKEMYGQLITKNEARSLLTSGDIMGALTLIRKLTDQTTRLVMYLDALKITKKKKDAALTNIVISEARLLIPQTDRNGIHIRALFSFTAHLANDETKADAFEFLNSAVTSVNALGKKSSDQKSAKDSWVEELDDPKSLFEAPEMEQAFTSLGLIDLGNTLNQANRLDSKPVQLLAKLQTVQGVIKRASLVPKAPSRLPKPMPNMKK